MNNELKKYIESVPAVADAAALRETFWLNEKKAFLRGKNSRSSSASIRFRWEAREIWE